MAKEDLLEREMFDNLFGSKSEPKKKKPSTNSVSGPNIEKFAPYQLYVTKGGKHVLILSVDEYNATHNSNSNRHVTFACGYPSIKNGDKFKEYTIAFPVGVEQIYIDLSNTETTTIDRLDNAIVYFNGTISGKLLNNIKKLRTDYINSLD